MPPMIDYPGVHEQHMLAFVRSELCESFDINKAACRHLMPIDILGSTTVLMPLRGCVAASLCRLDQEPSPAFKEVMPYYHRDPEASSTHADKRLRYKAQRIRPF
jgi:hypothetical protein